MPETCRDGHTDSLCQCGLLGPLLVPSHRYNSPPHLQHPFEQHPSMDLVPQHGFGTSLGAVLRGWGTGLPLSGPLPPTWLCCCLVLPPHPPGVLQPFGHGWRQRRGTLPGSKLGQEHVLLSFLLV